MHVLIAIAHALEDKERNRLAGMFKHMNIVIGESFSEVLSLIKENAYQLVVFVSFDESLPASWKIDEIEVENPIMILLKVNKSDLFMLHTFLGSIGMAVKPALPSSASAELHPLLYQSLQFIDSHLQENELSLEMVASSVYVSRCHYSRLFKEHVGTGFKEYIMQKRIEKAKELLELGQTVTEVCYAVGYGDLTHFGRVFKRLAGINPSVYRKRHGHEQDSAKSG